MPRPRVALVAGHWLRKGPGAVFGNKRTEEEFTHAIVLEIGKLLTQYNVSYRDCTGPSLEKEISLANQVNAEVYVEVHFNSHWKSSSNGTEVFYFPSSIKGQRLALAIKTRLVKLLKTKDRGIKPSKKLYVLKATKMPAVLVEPLFLSNKTEAALLLSPEGRRNIAAGIAYGILDYFNIPVKQPPKQIVTPQEVSLTLRLAKLETALGTLLSQLNRHINGHS